ncbi:MAG: rRNA maturation RNase YbeY [Acidimicrobiales bacterium]
MAVVGIDEQVVHPVDVKSWVTLAKAVLSAEGVRGPAELDLTFVDRDAMTDLNAKHMGGTGPTDVLSFPLDDDPEQGGDDQPRLLGDIVICPEVVHGQAPQDPVSEMALMVVHGVLHILGMDHADPHEAAVMKAAEERHLTVWRETSSA